jgi:hypothetical protein
MFAPAATDHRKPAPVLAFSAFTQGQLRFLGSTNTYKETNARIEVEAASNGGQISKMQIEEIAAQQVRKEATSSRYSPQK